MKWCGDNKGERSTNRTVEVGRGCCVNARSLNHSSVTPRSKAVNVFAEPGFVKIIVCSSGTHVEHFVGGDMSTVKGSVWRELNIKCFLT